MGSYSTDLLESIPTPLFTCPICLNIPNPESAVDHMQCGKIFCRDCVLAWTAKESMCPACSQKISDSQTDLRAIKAKNKTVYQIMIGYKIRCVNVEQTKEGCQWCGELQDFAKHIKECLYVTEFCRWGCGAQMQRKVLGQHEINECWMRATKCEFCEKQVLFDSLLKHKEKECEKCPDTMILCKYKELGCDYSGKRDAADKHNATCVKVHLAYAVSQIGKLKKTIESNDALIKLLGFQRNAPANGFQLGLNRKSQPWLRKPALRKNPESVPMAMNTYFKKCRKNHLLEFEQVPLPCACSGCGHEFASESVHGWICKACQFYICSTCSALQYERDKEPLLYTYCPKCMSEVRVLVKRTAKYEKSAFDCGCPNKQRGKVISFYYCAYCEFTVCAGCQMSITY